MELQEAREIVQDMYDTGIQEIVRMTSRLTELESDYAQDQWELTAGQIKNVKRRLEKRSREVKALGVILSGF